MITYFFVNWLSPHVCLPEALVHTLTMTMTMINEMIVVLMMMKGILLATTDVIVMWVERKVIGPSS